MTKSKYCEIQDVGPILLERSQRASRMNISVKAGGRIRVAVPLGISFQTARAFAEAHIRWIRSQIDRLRKIEETHAVLCARAVPIDVPAATTRLVTRAIKIAKDNGFDYNKIVVRNQKTRWGSCSGRNNISLNIKLIQLPEELMDYVILHELVHTRIKNHGPQFWRELDRFVGDARGLRTRLKRYSLLCMAS